jgi:hypothetical protein
VRVTREIPLRGSAYRDPWEPGKQPLDLKSYRDLYRYRIEGTRRLLSLAPALRECIQTERMTNGEFRDRLDFAVKPTGELASFNARQAQLKACLMPHVLGVRFLPFRGKPGYTLHFGVASPGYSLYQRRRRRAAIVKVYPVGTAEEVSAYRRASGNYMQPWSDPVHRCAEWVDISMKLGYQVRHHVEVAPDGRVVRYRLLVQGQAAKEVLPRIAGCALPFIRALRALPHKGPGTIPMRLGSSTAHWEPPRPPTPLYLRR